MEVFAPRFRDLHASLGSGAVVPVYPLLSPGTFTPVCCPFPVPVNLPVDSPWPRLLCRIKKSLLLSVTQSFRAFLRRTSSGFSHISSRREGPAERNPKDVSFLAAGAPRGCLRDCSQALGRPDRSSQRQGNGCLHDPHAPPTAAGFGLPRLVSSRPISSSCTRTKQIAYEVRCLTLMRHHAPLLYSK